MPDCSLCRKMVVMATETECSYPYLNGYSLDTIASLCCDHEKIRVIVKIGQGPVGPSPLYKRVFKEGHISEGSAFFCLLKKEGKIYLPSTGIALL